VGASNELPESEELDALYDRFLIRKKVEQVSSSGLRELLADTSEPSTSVGEGGNTDGLSVDITDETFNSIRYHDGHNLASQNSVE
jgi:MoxR-like ATPase